MKTVIMAGGRGTRISELFPDEECLLLLELHDLVPF